MPGPQRTARRIRSATIRRAVLVALLGSAILSAVLVASPVATTAPAHTLVDANTRSSCHGHWNSAPTPNDGLPGIHVGASSAAASYSISQASAVTALSADDVWIAGMDLSFDPRESGVGEIGGVYAPDVSHWNGKRWTKVPAPFLGSLTALSFDSNSDGWAAGYYRDSSLAGLAPLVEHWDGTRWTVSPALSQPGSGGAVVGLVAFSPSNAWIAVQPPIGAVAYLEHWNGSTWQYVDYPLEDSTPEFWALYGTAPDDIWVAASVGSDLDALHWNGSAWTVYPMPLPSGGDFPRITGFSAVSSSDVWAVGDEGVDAARQPLSEHWNGSQWTLVPVPSPAGTSVVFLNSVAATSASNAWAVGTYYGSALTGNSVDLFEHWDGTKWSILPVTADVPDNSASLSSVFALSATDIWAVGTVEEPIPGQDYRIQSQYTQAFHYGC
jgi:hypothetical protein